MNKFKRYLYFFIGTVIFGFGISFGNRSLFGGNSMAVMVVGLSNVLPFSVGTCNLLAAIVQIIIGTALDKSHTSLVSFASMFICSYSIDLANLIIKASDDITIRIIYMLVGIILYCFGLGLQQACDVGYSNLDIFIFGFKQRFNIKNYYTIRWPIDICFIIIGLLLKAPIGIGTLILLLFAGILIQKFKALALKLL